MPRTEGGTLAEHYELVLGRILDAFGAELAESGMSGLTLANVARRAGIARATIYNYAADKNELMLTFVERRVAEFVASIGRDLAARPTARERMTRLIEAMVGSFAIEPGAGSASGMMDGSTLPAGVFSELMARLSGLHGMVGEVLDFGIERGEFRAVSDRQASIEMISAVIGSQRMPVGQRERTVAEAVKQVTPFVLQAILA